MKYRDEWNQLARLPYFDGVTLGNLFGITAGGSLRMYVARAVARGQLIRLKRNLFVTADFYTLETDTQGYSEYISNLIYGPSYLSSEYVLQKYAILTESVFAYTAVTVKKTRKIINKTGSYLYASIQDDLFSGFEAVDRGGYRIRQATKAKALFDYLYFAVKPWRKVTEELFSELRLNLDEVSKRDIIEFNEYVNTYGSEKLRKVQTFLCNQ